MSATTIQINKGNLLTQQRGIMVHGCNCLGAMGAGFAKYLSDLYPDVKSAYERYHKAVGLKLGDVLFVRPTDWAKEGQALPLAGQEFAHTTQLPSELVIANAMTQFATGGARDGKPDIDYDALSEAFERIAPVARKTGLPVHFPLIGCGLAGGTWDQVAPRIEAALGPDVQKTLWVDERAAATLGL